MKDYFDQIRRLAEEREKRQREEVYPPKKYYVLRGDEMVCSKCFGRGSYDVDLDGSAEVTCNQCNGEGA
jgi:excinuclease UvrABC ATPase subunit